MMNEQNLEEPTIDSTAEITPEVQEAQPRNETVEKVFTQDEVNALLAKESAKLKRRLKKQTPTTIEEQKPPNGMEVVSQSLDKILSRLERLEGNEVQKTKETSFNSLISDRKVDDDLRGLLFASYDPANEEKTISILNKLAPPNSVPETNYRSPGAPTSPTELRTGTNPLAWTGDDCDVLISEDRFLESIEKWRETLPGGGSNLFSRKLKKQKR
jgi:hypothetical protein